LVKLNHREQIFWPENGGPYGSAGLSGKGHSKAFATFKTPLQTHTYWKGFATSSQITSSRLILFPSVAIAIPCKHLTYLPHPSREANEMH
jgi:hypothetical protein